MKKIFVLFVFLGLLSACSLNQFIKKGSKSIDEKGIPEEVVLNVEEQKTEISSLLEEEDELPIENVITITDPKIFVKTSKVEDEKWGEIIVSKQTSSRDLRESHFEVSGTNNPNVYEIRVVFKNTEFNLKDDYALTKFKLGDTSWKYVADQKYANLANGRNLYEVQAFSKEGDEKKLVGKIEFVLEATIPAKTMDVPDGSAIEVEFLAQPLEIDTYLFLSSIGFKKDMSVDGYTAEKIYELLDIYKLGNVTDGIYKGGTLYLVESWAEGHGLMNPFYRIIQNNDKTLIVLSKFSGAYIPEKDVRIFKFLEDKKTIINNLFPIESVFIPESKDKLIRTNRMYDFLKRSELTDLFYSSEIKQNFVKDETDCIYTKNNDGTYSKYNIDADIFKTESESKYSSPSGSVKLSIKWNDGKQTEEFYSYIKTGGCGFRDCYDVKPETEINDYRIVGKVANNNVYVKEASDISKVDDYSFYRSLSSVLIKDSLGRFIVFTNQEFIPQAECAKPVIYLYPEKTADVSVKVEPTGGFTKTEPEYNDGWKVRATPESKIYNYADKQDYPYLFWEGNALNYQMPEKGFVVAKENVDEFLIEKLALLGLNKIESADFREFWMPKMQAKSYYFVTFISKQYFDLLAPLYVSPQPDSVIRVFMDFKALDEKIEVEPLEIITPKREGFAVVEWGGEMRD